MNGGRSFASGVSEAAACAAPKAKTNVSAAICSNESCRVVAVANLRNDGDCHTLLLNYAEDETPKQIYNA